MSLIGSMLQTCHGWFQAESLPPPKRFCFHPSLFVCWFICLFVCHQEKILNGFPRNVMDRWDMGNDVYF